jgi:hypothetical protein
MAGFTMRTGGSLSSALLLSAESGEPVNLRSGRGSRVLVAVHSIRCKECIAYLQDVLRNVGEIAEWGGRLTAVMPGPVKDAARLSAVIGHKCECLADPGRSIASGDHAAVIIADEWGEVFFAAEPSPAHNLPAPAEIVEWTRFIAIQCPECGVPDAAWSSVNRVE